MIIKEANIRDAETLTRIAFKAKRFWNYPEEYFEIWRDELTLSSEYILKNSVFVAYENKHIIGFYSIVYNTENFYSGKVLVEKGFWLEHIFVLPDHHQNGVGKELIKHAINYSKKNGINSLKIFVDPFAEGFYKKMKATFKYMSPSSIKDREIPVYELFIN